MHSRDWRCAAPGDIDPTGASRNERGGQAHPTTRRPSQAEQVRDLRRRWNGSRPQGDLIETDKPVNPDLEVTGLQKHLDGGCPVLFNNVKGKPQSPRRHQSVRRHERHQQDVRLEERSGPRPQARRMRCRHPLKPVEIPQSEAPCQEHVIQNPKDVNEYMVPIRHTTYEPELTVGSGIRCVTGRYFDGGSDLGYNRMNFRWGNVGTFQISPGSHMWQVVNEYYKSDERVPITMCFGVPPACTLLAGAGFDYVILPQGLRRDRRRRRGAGRARSAWSRRARSTPWRWPIPSSCSKAMSIRATGASRRRKARRPGVQGRYHFHPEWAGYMGKAYKAPTFHVTAVTMRKPETQADHLLPRRPHARRPQHRHHGARGGDLRAVRAAAARHRPERASSPTA